MNTARAISRATQPPWMIFVVLAAKRVNSMPRNTTPKMVAFHTGHFQIQRVTARKRIVLTMKVPVTAMP